MRDQLRQNFHQPDSRLGGSPLDPFVDVVIRWIAAMPGGAPVGGLALSIATTFDWPASFAEVVLVGVNGRRLLRTNHLSSRPMRLMLSRRGEIWLEEHPLAV